MATNFTPLSANVQAAAIVSDAIGNLITGLAAMPVLVNSTDAAVQSFASDLAAAVNNLRGSCLYNADGSQKQLGGDVRAPYLAGAGL
jgi:hypothetical protein